MATKEVVVELVEKLLTLENEVKILGEEKKNLLASYKDKLDVKAFQAALRIAKIKGKLRDTSEMEFDNILLTVEDKLTIDWLD